MAPKAHIKPYDVNNEIAKNLVELTAPNTFYRYRPPRIRLGAVQVTFMRLLHPIIDFKGWKNL